MSIFFLFYLNLLRELFLLAFYAHFCRHRHRNSMILTITFNIGCISIFLDMFFCQFSKREHEKKKLKRDRIFIIMLVHIKNRYSMRYGLQSYRHSIVSRKDFPTSKKTSIVVASKKSASIVPTTSFSSRKKTSVISQAVTI